MKQKLRKLALALLVTLVGPGVAVACNSQAAVAIAKALSSVSEGLAFLARVDALVSEFFGRHPDVPTDARDTYLMLYDGAVVALTNYQRLVEAKGDLQNGEVLAAFEKFEAAYGQLNEWLTEHKLLGGGKLMLEGRVLSDVPPASAFKR